ncbi:MAG: hypothetical protein JWR59_501 [Brevundimonas sp.]|nr:hypothetical protein [Brevundimonas sp.]
MLWLTLATLILTDPAASPTASAMGPMTVMPAPNAATQAERAPRVSPFIQSPARACNPVIQSIDGRLVERPGPVGDGRVRLYRLFNLMDEQGCPAPVIVRDVPEADRSLGREIQ